MKKVFFLLKENISLSQQEVLSLINSPHHELVGNLLITETDFDDYERLAYTKRIYQLLFIAYKHNLEQKLDSFDWNSIYRSNFCLRTFEKDLDEKILAGHIWNALKNPKVNLTNPKTEIHILKRGSKLVCCLLIKQLKERYNNRRAHLRPAPLPITLHPRLARAIINLTGIKRNETLLDPFCGSGGILIESCLLKIKSFGSDIDGKIVEKAKQNLDFYNLKNYTLEQKDALSIKSKFDSIVTDLPYGLNTRKTDLKELYLSFLKHLELILKNKAVLIFPDFIDYKKLLNKTNLRIIAEFSYYIHKSLTKKIVLLEKGCVPSAD